MKSGLIISDLQKMRSKLCAIWNAFFVYVHSIPVNHSHRLLLSRVGYVVVGLHTFIGVR